MCLLGQFRRVYYLWHCFNFTWNSTACRLWWVSLYHLICLFNPFIS